MYKLTYKNKHTQEITVHGKIAAIVFILNDGESITLKEGEFKNIEKVKEL